jgi:hypothetical protein
MFCDWSVTLTVEQIAHIREVADQWTQAGLSTQRCDRPRAEDTVRSAYRSAGLNEPRLIVWMDSPVGGMFAAAVIKGTATAMPLANHVWSLIGEQPWDQVVAQLGIKPAQHLWTQITDQLNDRLGDQLKNRLSDPLERQLDDQLGRPLAEELRNRLWNQLNDRYGDRLGDQLKHHLRDPIGGGRISAGDGVWEGLSLWRDAAWLASMTCALSLAGLANSPRLDAVCAACREVDWWWPMNETVVLTDRPTVISRDTSSRLHDADGPALAYADSYTFACYDRH